MKEEEIKKIFKILLMIFLVIIAIKFFIYALPFILVGILAYLVYIKVKGTKEGNNNYSKKNVSKSKLVGEAKIVKERVEKE